ncbi:autotransporter domain-containing protein [Ancylobacter sp. WKF20]|uniref:autotransporter outer membrane beta-barrel domain-containing protein n=1 Tax=Ancylobacter sp. WKF20 TaxID=3039801 RepID=UPI0024343E81|nr:autotransporter outer membrane beta-barrel domain-containing protein [Ancylobacter sp. WKF20]WGD30777.1 autotransporter domain-containing protein [Ancylobacter sp. WKF20]
MASCAWILLPLGIQTAQADSTLDYINLNYPVAEANFTGIRGANIVGNYLIPDGNGASGGILYRTDTQSWIAIPTATANGVNYPGVYSASPYGPTFGSPDGGVFRLVGSYKLTSSSGDTGYIYDAAAAPGAQYTDIFMPSAPGLTVINTIPHSTFGNNVVGSFDTSEGEGGAFLYNMVTKSYTQLSGPGAVVTTAYGIYGDKVIGGYTDSGGLNAQHGFLYDITTDTWTTYDHPGAIATHFQGITGGGRNGSYNLASDWIDAQGGLHAAILHINPDGSTEWIELDVPGSLTTSIDSIYAGNAVGFYFDANGTMLNYFVTVPGVYDPIRNTSALTVSVDGATGITGISGDDIVNDSTITVSGANAVGIHADTYGVVTNNGTITVTGAGASGVEMGGLDGTLLNTGTITAAPGSYAVTTATDAEGTMVVNTGIIDGQVAFLPLAQGRFENSGWLGISAAGAGTTQQIAGVFAQTSTGTLALRVDGATSDLLAVDGAARLNGTLAASFTGTQSLLKSYTIVTASGGVTGSFASLDTAGLPSFFTAGLGYGATDVTLNVASGLANLPGLSANQSAVGAAIDSALNNVPGAAIGLLPAGLAPFYDLTAAQVPAALDALSGQPYASEQSVMISDGYYSRQSLLGRLRQNAYVGAEGPSAALAFGGPRTVQPGSTGAPPATAAEALAYATKAPPPVVATTDGPVFWAEGFGGWTNYEGTSNTAAADSSIGGVISGADVAWGDWRVGGALGYSQSSSTVDDLNASSTVNSLLLGLYAGTSYGKVKLRLGATYAFNDVSADRTIAFPGFAETANADYNGGTTQIFGEVGYGLIWNSLALEPYAGLAWVHLNTDSFTESGATSAGLTADSASQDVGYSTLGLRAATTVTLDNGTVLAPHGAIAWQYAFGDTTPTSQLALSALPAASFTVSGLPLAENTALVEAGLDLVVNASTRIGAAYIGQFADTATVNAFQVNLVVRF